MTTDGSPLIQLEGIKKVFYTEEVETHALSEIHLEIRRGDYVAIAGPSGCGKTTLLSILGLLDTASGGTYMLDGKSVAQLGASERARIRNREIGFIFQAFNLCFLAGLGIVQIRHINLRVLRVNRCRCLHTRVPGILLILGLQ